MGRPVEFKLPWNDSQVKELNNTLTDVFNVQYGRFELDIVTTTKTNAANGEIWILNNSGTYSLQVKAGGSVRSVTLSP